MPRLRAAVLAGAALVLVAAGDAGAQSNLKASFTVTPEQPATGEQVVLQATSTGGSGLSGIQHTWDLDDDGAFDDATGPTAQTRFETGGDRTIRLRAVSAGVVQIATRTITVTAPPAPPPPPAEEPQAPQPEPNQPPVAKYDRRCTRTGKLTWCPGLVVRQGEESTLDASPSSDPDGKVVRFEWDLDGNGTFETDAGALPAVQHVFEPFKSWLGDGRRREVALRVTDDKGATSEDRFTLHIAQATCSELVVLPRIGTARAGCLRPYNDEIDGKAMTRWSTKDPVTFNGIAIVPRNGAFVSFELPREDSGFVPRIRSRDAEVSMDAQGTPVVTRTGAVDWRIVDHRLEGFALDGSAKLNGLRMTGLDGPVVVGLGRATARVFVAMPELFGGATSRESLKLGGAQARAAQAGRPLSFTVPDAALGPIGLDELKVSFDGEDLWEVDAGIALPPPADLTVKGGAGIRSNGDFHHAEAEVGFGSGVPIGGPIPVYLQRIKFRIEIKPKKSECVPNIGVQELPLGPMKPIFVANGIPTTFDYGIPTFALCGEIGLSAGPSILGAAAVRLDAGLGFATYDDRPWVLRAFGKLKVVEMDVAEASFAVHGDGYVRMNGQVTSRWGDIFSMRGGIFFEMWKAKFNATASVEACLDPVDLCAGAKAIVSTKGVAACLSIDVWVTDWTPGIGYEWGASYPDIYFSGCDVRAYKEHIRRGAARAAQAGGERVIDLPKGLPGAVIAAHGDGAPPRITLVGPDGTRVETPAGMAASKSPKHLLVKDERKHTTSIALPSPAGGRWKVIVEDGSAPLVSLKSAEGLPAPDVKASVEGTGTQRTLRYRIAPVEGQEVTFVERGPSGGKQLGRATGTEGALAFTPSEGSADERTIVAVVTQDGQVREELPVAEYRAPGSVKPGRTAAIRAKRQGTRVQLAWPAVAGAARYEVRARMSNGRAVVRQTERAALALSGVPRRSRIAVRVRAISGAGLVGDAATRRVAAAKGQRR